MFVKILVVELWTLPP